MPLGGGGGGGLPTFPLLGTLAPRPPSELAPGGPSLLHSSVALQKDLPWLSVKAAATPFSTLVLSLCSPYLYLK